MSEQYTPSEDIELLVKRLREMATLQDAILCQFRTMSDEDAARVPGIQYVDYNNIVAVTLLGGGK